MLTDDDRDGPAAGLILTAYALAGAWALIGLAVRYCDACGAPLRALARALGASV